MNEYQKETAFLKRIILHEDTAERRELEKRMARVQCDSRCVRSATWLMALFTALAAAGLAYGAILVENFPDVPAQFIIKVLVVLGLSSLTCLVTFLCVLAVYRRRLNRLRAECRHIVANLLESLPNRPRATPFGSNPAGAADPEAARSAAEGNGSLGSLDSLREGVQRGLNKTTFESDSSPE